jgi:glutamine phosphoribosylpyrophosphate amidotransferase
LEEVYNKVEGAYACVAMLAGFGIIGFRDPYGIRPILMGARNINNKIDYMIASESVVLECLEFKNHRNLKPGPYIQSNSNEQARPLLLKKERHLSIDKLLRNETMLLIYSNTYILQDQIDSWMVLVYIARDSIWEDI